MSSLCPSDTGGGQNEEGRKQTGMNSTLTGATLLDSDSTGGRLPRLLPRPTRNGLESDPPNKHLRAKLFQLAPAFQTSGIKIRRKKEKKRKEKTRRNQSESPRNRRVASLFKPSAFWPEEHRAPAAQLWREGNVLNSAVHW